MSEPSRFDDLDPQETREWLESMDSVLKTHGAERAHFLLERLIDFTRRSGAYLPYSPNTAYLNTIPVGQQPEYVVGHRNRVVPHEVGHRPSPDASALRSAQMA